MNGERIKEVLDRRAAALAQPVHKPTPMGRSETLFLFRIHEEAYAIDAQYVQEAFAMKHCTPVPHTPKFLIGVTTVHGEIISIVDIAQFLGQPKVAVTNLNKVVVVRCGPLRFGIAVDEPEGLREVDMDTLRTAPGMTNDPRADFICGLTPEGEIVINLPAVSDSGRLTVDSERPTAVTQGDTS